MKIFLELETRVHLLGSWAEFLGLGNIGETPPDFQIVDSWPCIACIYFISIFFFWGAVYIIVYSLAVFFVHCFLLFILQKKKKKKKNVFRCPQVTFLVFNEKYLIMNLKISFISSPSPCDSLMLCLKKLGGIFLKYLIQVYLLFLLCGLDFFLFLYCKLPSCFNSSIRMFSGIKTLIIMIALYVGTN